MLGKLKRIPQQMKNRLAPGGLILLYHRVTGARPDPWECCVTPQHFAEHLEVLRKHFRPVPLEQMINVVTSEQPSFFSRRPIAVTFDDGYADNLHAARPLLECYEVPATVFVTSGNIERTQEFWSDEMERLLLQPGTLPSHLQLRINGEDRQWNLGEATSYSASSFHQHQQWNATGEADPTPRHQLYRDLYPLLQPMAEGPREQLFDELRRWSGHQPVRRETHRLMTLAELHSLAASELIEIGGHAVTHPMLSTLATEAQRDEIRQGKLWLEETLQRPLKSFAYPYGDYTLETATITREVGFERAVITRRGIVNPQSDVFQLPRVQVKDWSGKEFSAWLSHWLFD